MVCLEWCPVLPKAIYVEDARVVDADGKARLLKQPHLNASRCVGCGACAFACPLPERPGVYVSSASESRSSHHS
jgi:formate hydrogenlyase subunit 6/NADH:ubiquinone oxidoreductase subunit I